MLRFHSAPCALAMALLCADSGAQQALHTFHDGAPGTRFGGALDGAGDADGDGVPDLVVGAPRSGSGRGQVTLFSGASGAALWAVPGAGIDNLGTAVAGVGDLNGDGLDDVAVGAPAATGAAGLLWALSGLDGSLLWSRQGATGGDRFGQSVTGLGDLDGDGVPDLAVGAPFHDGGGTYAGRVELLSGADGSLLFADQGAAFDQFGYDLAGVGDLDGDGLDECAIGAPFDDRGGFNAGALVVLSGSSGQRQLEVLGATAGDWLGQEVAGAGDVDRDGVPDLLVSAPGQDAAGFDSGAVQVRSGAHGGLLFTIAGETPGLYMEAVAGPGDVDGDGAADVLVGASASGSGESGRIRLISGRTQAELCRIEGLTQNAWFGAELARVGDLNGDGRPDLAAGAPGHDDHPEVTGYVSVHTCAPAPGGSGGGVLVIGSGAQRRKAKPQQAP